MIYLISPPNIFVMHMFTKTCKKFYKFPNNITHILRCNEHVDRDQFIQGILVKRSQTKMGLYHFSLDTTKKNPEITTKTIDKQGELNWYYLCKYPWYNSIYNTSTDILHSNTIDIGGMTILENICNWKVDCEPNVINLWNQALCFYYNDDGSLIFNLYDFENNKLYQNAGYLEFKRHPNAEFTVRNEIGVLNRFDGALVFYTIGENNKGRSSITFYNYCFRNMLPNNILQQNKEGIINKINIAISYYIHKYFIVNSGNALTVMNDLSDVFWRYYPIWYIF